MVASMRYALFLVSIVTIRIDIDSRRLGSHDREQITASTFLMLLALLGIEPLNLSKESQ